MKTLLFLLLAASALAGPVDIALVLDRLRPKADWGDAATYESLVRTWRDTTQTLPTRAEIDAAWLAIEAELAAKKAAEEADRAALAEIDRKLEADEPLTPSELRTILRTIRGATRSRTLPIQAGKNK